jgi:NAD(P)H dehydrogenase (quinone)
MAIGVTGASGGVGSRVVRRLLEREDPEPVVALARRPYAVPSTAGLTARHADYDDASSLRAAFAGLGSLVFISSDGSVEPMRRHHEHVVAAAIEAGVEHVVYTSIVDIAPDSRFYYSPPHRETEALLAASGIARCLARTSIFADFFTSTWVEPALAEGTLALPAGSGRMSLVTRDDVARALAAAAATRREGIVDLTGPAALSAHEAAQASALRYIPLDEPAYRDRLAGEGAPGWLIEAFTTMFASVRGGRFEVVSPDGPELTGEPHQPFEEFVRQAVDSRLPRSS